jgi:hypothetical protein
VRDSRCPSRAGVPPPSLLPKGGGTRPPHPNPLPEGEGTGHEPKTQKPPPNGEGIVQAILKTLDERLEFVYIFSDIIDGNA